MRYYYEKPSETEQIFGRNYYCRHPLFGLGTLYFEDGIGVIVIQQHFDEINKTISWGPIDPWLANDIYTNPNFNDWFLNMAKEKDANGWFPVISVRKVMWALRMKPLKREFWEVFE